MKFVLENGEFQLASEPAWYDLGGQAKERLKEEMTEMVVTFLEVLADVLVDLSFSIALVGGGILIILRTVTGVKKFGQWSAVLFICYALITFLLG